MSTEKRHECYGSVDNALADGARWLRWYLAGSSALVDMEKAMRQYPLAYDACDDEFETMNELVMLVSEQVAHVADCHPESRISSVVISEHQLKLLRLECYMHGMPEEDVLIMEPDRVCGVPVIVIFDNGTYRCPECGNMHEFMDI